MEVRIPVNRIFVAELTIERVGIGQDVRIEEVVEAERR
jgi:hypothetical protein